MEEIGGNATVICPPSMMRSAITSSLEEHGIRCCDQDKNEVAIVVSGLLQGSGKNGNYQDLEDVDAKQWIVMTHEDDDPIYQRLCERGMDPCVVPEDISAKDLSHVVRLAASGHIISLGRLCRNADPDDARLLNQANLSQDQWRMLEHLAKGLSNKEIAIIDDTTESAVKARLRCLLKKLKLNNRTKAAVLAARCGVGKASH